MKPIIGLSTGITASRYYVMRDYIEAVWRCGGTPLLLPCLSTDGDNDLIFCTNLLSRVDGLLLTGGGDIDPIFYGEHRHQRLSKVYRERDKFEITLVRIAIKQEMPVLGICRGAQVLNVAYGGTLNQRVETHWQKSKEDQPTHNIRIEKGTKLAKILEQTELMVNSFHRQTIKELAFDFTPSAYADDGVVEAIETLKNRFVIGLQFHPENLFRKSPSIKRIFSSFIHACKGLVG